MILLGKIINEQIRGCVHPLNKNSVPNSFGSIQSCTAPVEESFLCASKIHFQLSKKQNIVSLITKQLQYMCYDMNTHVMQSHTILLIECLSYNGSQQNSKLSQSFAFQTSMLPTLPSHHLIK